MPTMTRQGIFSGRKVAIVSRDGKACYDWFIRFLLTFLDEEDIQPVFISNQSYGSIIDKVAYCSLVILYHTKRRGRVNIIDVNDSLYDQELKDLSSHLGRQNVIVLVDDLDIGTDEEKNRILINQPRINRLARELFVFSKEEKEAYIRNDSTQSYNSALRKLSSIKSIIIIIIKKDSPATETGASNETDHIIPHQQPIICFKKYMIWIIFIAIVLLLILVLSLTLR